MKNTKIYSYFAMALGAISSYFGEFDGLLKALLIFMVIDYITGWTCAVMGKSPKATDGKLNSNIGAKGLIKKAMIMLCVLISVVLDEALGQKNMFRNATIMFYIANEGLSFVENLGIMGVPFPKSVKDAISALSHDGDNNK